MLRQLVPPLNRLFLFIGAALLVVLTIQPAVANAYDQAFYSNNNILFYDPTASSCTTNAAVTNNLVGSDNPSKIFNFLVNKGLSAGAAAGLMANLQAESGFNPNMQQGGTVLPDGALPTANVGYGIVQWTSPGRQQNLVQYAQATNRPPTDLTLQLDFMWKELTDPSLATGSAWANTVTNLKATTDPVQAATIVHYDYERSGAWPGFPPIRGTYAQQIFQQYGGTNAAAAGASGTQNSNVVCNGQGIGDYTSSQFALYNQCDSQWGNIQVPGTSRGACQVACGPTSMAMIIKNMTGQNVTPADTINYVTQTNQWITTPPGGTTMSTNADIATHWGLTASVIPASSTINDITNILNNHGLVMMAGEGPTPFLTSTPHFVVIRGVTSDGKFMVADPNGHSGNYDENQIMASIKTANAGGVSVATK